MAEFDDCNQGRQDATTAIGLAGFLTNASLQAPGIGRAQAGNLQPGIVPVRRRRLG